MSNSLTYQKLLLELETKHKKEVTDLVTKTKTIEKLIWRNFSRDLDDIYENYKGETLAVAIDYVFKNKGSILDEVNIKRDEFKKFCNSKFKETCDYFEESGKLI